MSSLREASIVLAAVLLTVLTAWPAQAEDVAPESTTSSTESPVENTVEPSPELTEPVPTESTPTAPEPTDPTPTDPTPTTPAPTTPAPTTPAPTTPPPADPDVQAIDDAELRWGLNNESNNKAFDGRSFNLLRAGRLPDPGSSRYMDPSEWRATSGNVRIEKRRGSSYELATWAGTQTDSNGERISSATSGRFSNHQVVITGGTGEVDFKTKTAKISWKGDFTVAYYGGLTFFYVSDPVLEISPQRSRLTATVGGFGSDMNDPTTWVKLEDRDVTLADLPRVTPARGSRGFSSVPTYVGTSATIPGDAQFARQQQRDSTNAPYWGSFPQSFIDFHVAGGSAAYWYTSGGLSDRYKPALPITVSYDESEPVTPPVPPTESSGEQVTNELLAPPGTPPGAALARTPSPVAAAAPASPAIAPAAAEVPFLQAGDGSTMTADELAAATARALWWWLGAVLLTLAAGSVAGTFAYTAAAGRADRAAAAGRTSPAAAAGR